MLANVLNCLSIHLQDEARNLTLRWVEIDSNIDLPKQQLDWLKKLSNEKKAKFDRLDSVEQASSP